MIWPFPLHACFWSKATKHNQTRTHRSLINGTTLCTDLHKGIASVHLNAKVLSQQVVDVSVLQIGERLVRYMVESEIAGVAMQLSPLVVDFRLVQQLSDEPFLIACHYLLGVRSSVEYLRCKY